MNKFIKLANLLIVICLALVSNLASALTPPNSVITNTANISYVLENGGGSSPTISNVSVNSTSTTTTSANGVPPTITLGGVVGNPSSTDVLQNGACYSSSGTVPYTSAQLTGQSNVSTLPSNVNFVTKEAITSGQSLVIQVKDLDYPNNPTTLDTIRVKVTSLSGDIEEIQLTETGVNTGLYLGYVPLSRVVASPSNCLLSVIKNDKLTATYVSNGQLQTVSSSILVDPLGRVFDTSTGSLINGTTITLINDATGLPAQVFGDDGVSSYPSTVITGQNVTDGGGTLYVYGQGEYRFPLVAPGTYRLQVSQPVGFTYPTALSNAQINSRFPGQFIVTTGSRGENFNVVAAIVVVDIPVDSSQGSLVVNKTTTSTLAAIGDFVQYQITLQNTDTNSVSNVTLEDILPKGLRYVKDSLTVDKTKVEPSFGSNNQMALKFANIAGNQTLIIKYVAQITVATKVGKVKNTATAFNASIRSNIASAEIEVKDELMMNKPIILGTVFETNTCKPDDLRRLKNIKIQFETGDYVISDQDGLWHVNNLSVGTHVAKIDKMSIPKGYDVISCEKTNDFAGAADSRFVSGKPGLITKVDFYLKKNADYVEPTVQPNKTTNEDTNRDKNLKKEASSGTEALSLNDKFMETITTESKILFPSEGFAPSTNAVGFAFQYNSLYKPQLFINGERSPEFNFDGVRQSADSYSSIMYWRALPLKNGKNKFEVKLYDEGGNLINTTTKEVYYSTTIVNAIFVPKESSLEANGTDIIKIAVRLVDEEGHPVHKGLVGNFEYSGSFTPYFDRENGLPVDMIANRQNSTQFIVEENGLAYIKFMPTQQSGELLIKFKLINNKTALIRPWINGLKRDWIFVGVADATIGKNKSVNYRENDVNGIEMLEGNDGRVAFYGKGTVAKDYLLTIAYDNKKERLNPGQMPIGQTGTLGLMDQYPIYGDSTTSQRDAQSAKKFYIRIEREKFFALFGDYQTNFNVTELIQYNRVLNGFKSEYKGEKASYNVFASQDSTLAQREEVLADGTTGPYRLSNKPVNLSEIVTVVTRDRNQRDVVLATKVLTRYIDYDIDYDLKTIRLKTPVSTYDLFFNPNLIRVEYNSEGVNKDNTVVGGRAAYKITDSLEVGVSGVMEDSPNKNANMKGTDLVYEKNGLRVKAEVANSERNDGAKKETGNGYNFEIKYDKEWGGVRVYSKKTDETFGVTSVLANEVGIQKTGAEINLKLDKGITVRAAILNQKDLKAGTEQTIAEARVEKEFSPQAIGYVGAKTVKTNVSQISGQSVSKGVDDAKLVTFGGQYKIKDTPLTLTGQAEINAKPSETIPSKYRVGVQYDLNANYAAVADTELAIYEDNKMQTNRVGIIAKPAEGVKIQNYIGNINGDGSAQFIENISDRAFKWGDNWSFTAGFASRKWNKPLEKGNIPAGTLATFDDYSTYQIGAAYSKDDIINQSRVEYRKGDKEDKILLKNDFYYKLNKGFAVSLGEEYTTIKSEGLEDTKALVRGGLSYRDIENINTVLARVDLISEKLNDVESKKLVANTHYNYKPYNDGMEYNAHIGYKYVLQSFDEDEYSGSSFVGQLGIKKQLNQKFDIASEALYAVSTSSGVSSMGINASLGYLVAKNTVVAVGYQYIKDYDRNFDFDDAYIQGLYFRIKMKFDENTFHLNPTSTSTKTGMSVN